ncbi:MAG: hypothetical protein ACX94C_14180 [Phycisphaerales bacterium]
MSEPKKPVMRVIRNLARSGGTLLGKCIGCMEGVTLISEIHPADLRTTGPMAQAHSWFGLIGKDDMLRWKVRPPSVGQFVALCDLRARERGSTLVLRDWSHVDYVGVPVMQPRHGFMLRDAISDVFDVRCAVTTRHPIDQYLSLVQLELVRPHLVFEQYCAGCLRFAEFAEGNGFQRYEDFTKDPDTVLRAICDDLDLAFDAGYREKWHAYTTITGDTVPTLGRGSQKKEIVHMPRKAVDEALVERFRGNEDYLRACAIMGYEA